jgi:hypothetical protein
MVQVMNESSSCLGDDVHVAWLLKASHPVFSFLRSKSKAGRIHIRLQKKKDIQSEFPTPHFLIMIHVSTSSITGVVNLIIDSNVRMVEGLHKFKKVCPVYRPAIKHDNGNSTIYR